MADSCFNQVKPEELVRKAEEAKQHSYSPYSKFRVGAAVLTKEGRVFGGCNVENASYPCGVCAERTAICKAVSEGFKDIVAIAVIGDTDDIITPCGICRQTLREFSKTMTILCARADKSYEKMSIKKLLEHSFGPDNLKSS